MNQRQKKILELIEKYDLILCMTASHKLMLGGISKVHTISEVTGGSDVSDPYGGDLTTYIKTSHQLEDACNVIISEILKAKGEN